MANVGFRSFLDLSDDVILMIFSYLKGYDLANLAESCERFHKIASDKSLWVNADFSSGCTSLQQFKHYSKFLTQSTKRLVLRGYKKKYAATPKWKTPLISAALLKFIGDRCPNLQSLVISEGYIDANKLKIVDFETVPSLVSLRIEDCEFVNLPTPPRDGSYFKRTHKVLPRLEELLIIKCGWVDDYDVMVLSKADSLKRLVLRNVPRVGRAMAYLALAFRFGFQNLEELDLRGTSLQDSEVNSIVQNGKLRALYLGPVGGRVMRLSEEASTPGHNLVMPDPRRRQEERQQVVVINVGPDGPQWRQVGDEELEGLGLQWVRNAPVARQQPQHDPDRHYFIGQDGRPIGDNEEHGEEQEEEDEGNGDEQPQAIIDPLLQGGPSKQIQQQQPQPAIQQKPEEQELKQEEEKGEQEDEEEEEEFQPQSKRQRPEDQELQQEDQEEQKEEQEEYKFQPPSKRPRLDPANAAGNSRQKNDCECEEEKKFLDKHENHAEDALPDDGNNENAQHMAEFAPDEGLSDHVAAAFRGNTKHLQSLVLSGCAITDTGLHEILRVVPSLRYLDVSNTRVTSDGVQQARVTREDCVIMDRSTGTTSDNNR